MFISVPLLAVDVKSFTPMYKEEKPPKRGLFRGLFYQKDLESAFIVQLLTDLGAALAPDRDKSSGYCCCQ